MEFEEYSNRQKKRTSNIILGGVCNKNLSLFTDDKKVDFSIYDSWKCYDTVDNGSIGFLVFVDELNKFVYVYARTTDVIPKDYDYNSFLLFNNIVGKYEHLQIFIGASSLNEMTEFSGGHGDNWDGNTILLRIGTSDEYRYLYIGSNIIEFVTDEIITNYISSVGNNEVAYPYAESDNWCYNMINSNKTPITEHDDRHRLGHVSYIKGATYTVLDFSEIRDYNSDHNVEYEEYVREYVKFNGPVTFSYVKNSCNI